MNQPKYYSLVTNSDSRYLSREVGIDLTGFYACSLCRGEMYESISCLHFWLSYVLLPLSMEKVYEELHIFDKFDLMSPK